VPFFDYDNDGLPDLVLADGHPDDSVDRRIRSVTYPGPLLLFYNAGGGKMTNVSKSSGAVFEKRSPARSGGWRPQQ